MRRFSKVAGVLTALAPLSSYAAVDAAITTALSTAQADGLTVIGIITGLLVAFWAGKLLYRKFFGG